MCFTPGFGTVTPWKRVAPSPSLSPAAAIRRGDRVVVKTRGGELIAKELARKTSKAIELKSLGPAQPDRMLATEDYLWIARIVWASQ